MTEVKTINANTLRNWLELGQPVNVLDIRPMSERSEWFIPQSIHFNAYDKLKNNNFEAFNGLHLDKSVPVVTFCAGGRMSLVAAKFLQIQGYDTYSLEGGIKAWSFENIGHDTVFKIGNIQVSAIKTPGHTFESTTFNVENKVLLTGDTLFTNGVGRPDLKADTEGVKEKSKLLFQSLQKLLSFDDDIIVLPSHTSQPVEFDSIPIQTALGKVKSIPMLQLSENEFIETILNRIPPTPANYLSIVEKNIKGDFSDINPIDLEAGANRCAIS
jgi:rhodanese-related sulfurtransferase